MDINRTHEISTRTTYVGLLTRESVPIRIVLRSTAVVTVVNSVTCFSIAGKGRSTAESAIMQISLISPTE